MAAARRGRSRAAPDALANERAGAVDVFGLEPRPQRPYERELVGDGGVDRVLRRPLANERAGDQELVLHLQDREAVDRRTGHEDREGDVVALRGDVRREVAALAVAQEAHRGGVDARVGDQQVEAGAHVAGEVGEGGVGVAAGAAADAAVVDAQDREAGARQPVGEQQEGLVADELLVAVLRAAARDQQHGRHAILALGQRERARERDVAVLVGHLLLEVREGRHRFLRAQVGGLGPLEGEGEGLAALGEGALDGVAGDRALEQGVAGDARHAEASARRPRGRPGRGRRRSTPARGCRACRRARRLRA